MGLGHGHCADFSDRRTSAGCVSRACVARAGLDPQVCGSRTRRSRAGDRASRIDRRAPAPGSTFGHARQQRTRISTRRRTTDRVPAMTPIAALLLVIATLRLDSGLAAAAQPPGSPEPSRRAARYENRPVADVLRELQAAGLRIVFSSEIVTPGMRVRNEPRATLPRQV